MPGAGGEVDHRGRAGLQFVGQFGGQIVRRNLLHRRQGRQDGARRAGLQPVPQEAAVQHIGVPAHLGEPRGGHVGPGAQVVGQHDPRAAHRGEHVGLLHQLPARRALEAGDMALGIFLGGAHVEAIEGPVAHLRHAGQLLRGQAAHAGAVGHGAGAGPGLVRAARGPALEPARLAVVQVLAGQGPAYGSVAQGGYGVGQAGVDQGLGADDAAGAPGAIDHDGGLRIGRQVRGAQDQLGPGYADPGGNAHGLEFVEPARVQHHHVGLGVDQGLQVFGGDGRGMAPGVDQFAKGLAVGIDVLEQLIARRPPALESALQRPKMTIAQLAQAFGRGGDQALAVVIQHDRRVLAGDAAQDLQLQPAERQAGGEQGMSPGEGVFFAQVDQGDFPAGDQGQADLGGGDGLDHGWAAGVFERSHRLGRVALA